MNGRTRGHRGRRVAGYRRHGWDRSRRHDPDAAGKRNRSSGDDQPGGMLNADRFKLLFGPYRSPRCRVGRTWLRCAIRGNVKVVGISDTPIRLSAAGSLRLSGARAIRRLSTTGAGVTDARRAWARPRQRLFCLTRPAIAITLPQSRNPDDNRRVGQEQFRWLIPISVS